jgi:hypothetical protein
MKYIYIRNIYIYIIMIYIYHFIILLILSSHFNFFLFNINLIKRNNFLQITERFVLQLDLMSPKKPPPFL